MVRCINVRKESKPPARIGHMWWRRGISWMERRNANKSILDRNKLVVEETDLVGHSASPAPNNCQVDGHLTRSDIKLSFEVFHFLPLNLFGRSGRFFPIKIIQSHWIPFFGVLIRKEKPCHSTHPCLMVRRWNGVLIPFKSRAEEINFLFGN